MKTLGLNARQFALALSLGVLFASLGCGDGGSGGQGGSAAERGAGGAGGSAGDGGADGAGGETTASALEICEAWCRNETRGPSCCVETPFFGGNCREECFDRCEDTVAEGVCLEAQAAVRECQMELACDDFFDECRALEGRYEGCLRRAAAEASGRCTVAAAGCGITEAECLSTFEAGTAECAISWDDYVFCAGDGFFTCEECVEFTQPFGEDCDWPSGASEDVEFVPQSCDTLPLPPAGCDAPCPGGNDTECGFGTYCEAAVCETDCVANSDCARGDACSVRGRCLPTIFGSPLECSWFDDPPTGCGALCPTGNNSECPEGTFCISNLCDAQCRSDEQCGLGEQCSPIGVCEEIPLPECSDGRSLDETFASDRESLTCSILGAIDAIVDVELTAKPTAPLQSGSNTYDLQFAISIDAGTTAVISSLGVTTLRFLEVSASVAPTLGTTSPSSIVFQNTPLPCDVRLVEETPIEVIMPAGQATWNLDDGSTQELAVDGIDVVFSAAGLNVPFTTGPDATCTWDTEPARVSFSVP